MSEHRSWWCVSCNTDVSCAPGLPCPKCGDSAAPPDDGVLNGRLSPPDEEHEGGVVLRLVPKGAAQVSDRSAQCRRILLHTLQRIEAGEIESLVLVCDTGDGFAFQWSSQRDMIRTVGAST